MFRFKILFLVTLAYRAIEAEEIKEFQTEQSGYVPMISADLGHNFAGGPSLPGIGHSGVDGQISGQAVAAIKGSRALANAGRIAQTESLKKARALEAARIAYLHRAQAAALENARAIDFAHRTEAAIALELQRAAVAAKVANNSRLQIQNIVDFIMRQAQQRAAIQEQTLIHDLHVKAPSTAVNEHGH